MSNHVKEIEELTQRLAKHEPVAGESEAVVQRVIDSPDPAALPALKRALKVAVEYQQWAEGVSKRTDSNFKKNAPGGWFVDAMPHYGKRIVESLQTAIEKCTPQGQPVVHEPKNEDHMQLRKGRLVFLMLAAIAVWLGGSFVIYRVWLSDYTYSMERVNATGVAEPIYQPGEREARATAGNATLVLTSAVVVALAVTVGIGVRPGSWLREGA